MNTSNETVNHEEPDAGRRTLLKMTGVGVAALGVASVAGAPAFAQGNAEWDKVFPKSSKVDHEKVSFQNRYGITLVGDLYLPKNRSTGTLPAIVVGGPFGAVK
ncbi:alpha/beta hydrolase, partial [Rhizobium ruizarguesonis]